MAFVGVVMQKYTDSFKAADTLERPCMNTLWIPTFEYTPINTNHPFHFSEKLISRDFVGLFVKFLIFNLRIGIYLID